ncbi:MAG: hypothetical protein Q8P24_00005 [Desulfobacterales bacterium]|nr:hypothetical protein [Desulfobacterales bacterium]
MAGGGVTAEKDFPKKQPGLPLLMLIGGIFRIGRQLKKTLKALFYWSIIAKF